MKKLRLYLQVIQQCILILPYSPNKLQKALFSTLLVIRFNDLPQSGLFIFAGLTVSFVMGKYKFRQVFYFGRRNFFIMQIKGIKSNSFSLSVMNKYTVLRIQCREFPIGSTQIYYHNPCMVFKYLPEDMVGQERFPVSCRCENHE